MPLKIKRIKLILKIKNNVAQNFNISNRAGHAGYGFLLYKQMEYKMSSLYSIVRARLPSEPDISVSPFSSWRQAPYKSRYLRNNRPTNIHKKPPSGMQIEFPNHP
ncbi:hypothetical protein [Odoribacter lunatus]|uniref:hypothetical protein n=1 Tax=Odoribacter lunatus TaxID=2941335 RepID=UPI00203E689C|nr:hypothetical protein [Odoribacter lunatus]